MAGKKESGRRLGDTPPTQLGIEVWDPRERLGRAMRRAAEALEFERARFLRDELAAWEPTLLPPPEETKERLDLLTLARQGAWGVGLLLRLSPGEPPRTHVRLLKLAQSTHDSEAASALLLDLYALSEGGEPLLPAPVLVFPGQEAEVGDWLPALEEEAGSVEVRQAAPSSFWVQQTTQAARTLLERHLERERRRGRRPELPSLPQGDATAELERELQLPRRPERILCFDISHTQGSETVASCVAFRAGQPDKSEYRRLRIQGEWGNDDYRSMNEAVGRYFRRRLEEKKELPDLVLIDGGKGQLSAAYEALQSLGLEDKVPLASLAKKEEEVFRPGRSHSVRLSRHGTALRLLQRLRDEAHRFAITYNRQLRARRTVSSELGEIPGIGPARQQALLERFGSLRALQAATLEDVAELPGFGPELATAVLRHLHPTGRVARRAPGESDSP